MPQPITPHAADPRRFQGDLLAACGAFRVHPASRPDGSVTAGRIGGFDLVRVATNARAIERDARDARRDHAPHYFLIRQLAGTARMMQRDQQAVLAPGDFFLASSIRPALFRYGETSVQASLHLPRPALAGALGQIAAGGLHLPTASIMGRAVTRALARIGNNPDDIVELLAMAARDDQAGDLRLTDLALRLIDRHSSDPGFGPAGLAATMGISLRGLQRALATEGISASGAIQDRRMQAVCALLRNRPYMTVTACAEAAGFPDISRFNRDFRDRQGCTPTQFRLTPR